MFQWLKKNLTKYKNCIMYCFYTKLYLRIICNFLELPHFTCKVLWLRLFAYSINIYSLQKAIKINRNIWEQILHTSSRIPGRNWSKTNGYIIEYLSVKLDFYSETKKTFKWWIIFWCNHKKHRGICTSKFTTTNRYMSKMI